MSTKTNFKRIALVAVAALGLGVLSSVPVQAAPSAITIDVVDGTATTALSDSTGAATVTIKGLLGVTATDSISVLVAKKSAPTTAAVALMPLLTYLDTVSGGVTGEIEKADGATDATGWSTATTGIDSATPTSALHITSAASNTYNGFTALLYIDTATLTAVGRANTTLVAGTYVYTIIATPLTCAVTGCTAGTAVIKDVSIVVSALTSASTTPTATYSYIDISADTGAGNSTGRTNTTDATISALATAGTAAGSIFVGNRNSSDVSTLAKESITATVVGAGLVCTGTLGSATAGTCGKSVKVAATGDYQFLLQADGSSGLSTITVSSTVSGVTAVKTLNYYSAAAKTLTATNLTPILAIGSNDSAVSVVAVDSAGVAWAGTAYIYASTAADATAVGGSATTPVACTMNSSKTTHYCPITATAAGTGKFKVIDAATVALATATSNEVTVTSSNSPVATLKIAFSKASYAPNEVGYFVITGLDAAGKALPASTITNGLATGGITSASGLTMTTCTSLTSKDVTIAAYSGTTSVAGSQMCIFTAPSVGGVISLTAKGGTGLPLAGQVALSASATVTDNAAAALAAVTALATTVASLKTLITTLTNLVLKIQKKVKV